MARYATSGGGAFDYVQGATPSGAEEGEEWYADGSGTKSKGAYVYDGASWIEQTVTDHGKLSGISASDHHTRPTPGGGMTEDANGNFDVTVVGYVHLLAGTGSTGNTTWTNIGQANPTYLNGESGTWRGELRAANSSGTCQVRLRDTKNGVTLAGPVENGTTTYASFTRSFTFPTGDAVVQMQMRDASGGGYLMEARNHSANIEG